MNARQTHPPASADMPEQVDGSKRIRGKCHRAGARSMQPIRSPRARVVLVVGPHTLRQPVHEQALREGVLL